MLDQDPAAPTALLDFPDPLDPQAPRWRWRFGQPRRWLVAHDAHQVPGLLDAAHDAARQGCWCLGWVAYEAAPGLNAHLPVKALPPGQPYAVWAIYEQAEPWPDGLAAPDQMPPDASWSAHGWQAGQDDDDIGRQIETIRDLIRAGEVYQINLTGRLESPWSNPKGPAQRGLMPWFEALQRSQPQAYSLLLDSRAVARHPGVVLSVSPELFVDWHGAQLTTRPMKGTAARARDPHEDQAAADHLRTSPKERAENLMIVDLLRNDLSRVAQVGSVQVPRLFDVQAWPTVWQMTSTITALSRPGLRLSALFEALFPCGSVTGAPKRQAMHHIARLEQGPRGVYCGAVGVMQPGGRVTFNVPIRTVTMNTPPPPAPWVARCGIGSGITLDAHPEGEIAEWQAKQAFLRRADQPFELLESLRLESGEVHRLAQHLNRLHTSAAHFHWPWADGPQHTQVLARATQALQAHARQHPEGVYKLRLLVDVRGQVHTECAPLLPWSSSPSVALAERAMPAADDFIRHKTTRRQAYAAFAPPDGCVDTLLYNGQGELTEFTIGNVAMQLGAQWYTPPLSCGLLPGVMRSELLKSGRLVERVLTLDDLKQAAGVALLNSVRGWVAVNLSTPTSN